MSKTITETVTLTFDVKLDYQNDAGREYLVRSLKRDAHVDMGGAGVNEGVYGMKSVEGSARVTMQNQNKKPTNESIT